MKLKASIILEGESDSEELNIKMEFDLPIGGEHAKAYSNSAVGDAIKYLLGVGFNQTNNKGAH